MSRLFVIAASVLVFAGLAPAGASTPGHVSGFVIVALNPQPEPPGRAIVSDLIRVRAGAAEVELNPQPEPPGVTDARKLLPPGPCSTVIATVEGRGAAVSAHAVATQTPGRCRYDITTPGLRPGAMARVTFTRAR